MGDFFRYYLTTFLRPRQGFESLLHHPHSLRYACLYVLIPITGYTLMYIFLTIGHGAPSIFTPWLNIPRENYYSINRFLLAPSMVLCWFTTAAFIQVMSPVFNGKGTFEQTLSVLGLSISVAMWGGLIHDLPMSFMSALQVIDARQHEVDMNSPTIWRTLLWICYSIYAIAFFTLFISAVRFVQKVSIPASCFLGVLGFALFQIIFLIFNR